MAEEAKLSRAHGKMEAMCESCSGDKAESFCQQCTQFICAECVRLHHKLKVFAGHKTVSLEELKEGGAKDIVVEEAPLQMCPEHDEQMKIYCFDCNRLICRDCTVKDHIGHNYEFIKKAAPKVKTELLEQLNPLKEVRVSLLYVVDEIQITKSEVEAQVGTVSGNIESLFEELQQILAHRKQKLLEEAAAEGTQKLEHLSSQENKLFASCAVVQSVIEYTEQCLGHSADDEVMCMRGEIQSRIEREIAEHKYDDLYPVEEADIGVEVSCVEALKQLCQTKAKLKQLCQTKAKLPAAKLKQLCQTNAKLIQHIEEFAVAGEGIKSAEVNKLSEFSVTAKLSNGKLMKGKLFLDCHLKSLANGSITRCSVDGTNADYRIQYIPTVRGRHEIILTTPGLKIPGSPFPVFVSINPAQLVKPVMEITASEELYHVAINSAGEVIATCPSTIFIFRKSGELVTSINFEEELGFSPLGVAVDSDNCVYTNSTDGNVAKLNPKLKLMKKTTFDASFLVGMVNVGDELMMCNYMNRSIMVLTKELDLARQIDVSNITAHLWDLDSDNHGNLFVCGWKLPIHVFTKSGQFLRSFGAAELSNPLGICVAGEYVYVTDRDDNTIFAYTTEGEYVTSFKQQSFKRPWGVRADRDGFIYICDFENKRVLVF